jgi:hypothetical protein
MAEAPLIAPSILSVSVWNMPRSERRDMRGEEPMEALPCDDDKHSRRAEESPRDGGPELPGMLGADVPFPSDTNRSVKRRPNEISKCRDRKSREQHQQKERYGSGHFF